MDRPRRHVEPRIREVAILTRRSEWRDVPSSPPTDTDDPEAVEVDVAYYRGPFRLGRDRGLLFREEGRLVFAGERTDLILPHDCWRPRAFLPLPHRTHRRATIEAGDILVQLHPVGGRKGFSLLRNVLRRDLRTAVVSPSEGDLVVLPPDRAGPGGQSERDERFAIARHLALFFAQPIVLYFGLILLFSPLFGPATGRDIEAVKSILRTMLFWLTAFSTIRLFVGRGPFAPMARERRRIARELLAAPVAESEPSREAVSSGRP